MEIQMIIEKNFEGKIHSTKNAHQYEGPIIVQQLQFSSMMVDTLTSFILQSFIKSLAYIWQKSYGWCAGAALPRSSSVPATALHRQKYHFAMAFSSFGWVDITSRIPARINPYHTHSPEFCSFIHEVISCTMCHHLCTECENFWLKLGFR